MKATLLFSLVTGAVALPGAAQTNVPLTTSGVTQAPKSAGLVNDWLRDQSPAFEKWDIGGQVRVRGEHKENFAVPGLRPEAVDFRKEGGAGNTYLLFREKIHLGYKPVDWLGAFVEARDSSSHWDRRSPDPESDVFDLHQGYLTLGDGKAFPLVATIGRQELSYGDERLIGAFDWNNIGRVFDAARVRWKHEGSWVDAFVGRVIIPDDNSFNVPNDYDIFSGIYGSTTELLPWQESQLYFLSRNADRQSPNAIGENLPAFMRGASARDIYTVGARVKSLPGKLTGWDYSGEIAGQFGNFYSAANDERDEHRAFAAHVGGGYTWAKAFGTPRVGLEYNYSTGDSDPEDDRHETFDNLFPTNHKFYGYMDFFSWQNIHNPRLSLSIKPAKKLTLTADFHAFWLANTHDYFYQANGAPRTGGGYGIAADAGSFVGTEIDVVATYNVTSFAAVQAGYGHFFAQDYPQDSLEAVGGAEDADWGYLQLVFNF